MKLVLATRGSRLALAQAGWVAERLKEFTPGLEVDFLTLKTTGDRILDAPLAKIGGKGLFVKEIEEAVLDGRAHLAVHSIKDLPADPPAGLTLAAIPPREDRRDVLVSRGNLGLEALPPQAKVGTSSLRRAAQLSALRPDLEIVPLRGNVETRLAKVDQGQVLAAVLAAAGLKRLGLIGRVSQYLPPDRFVPAVGQGALGVECALADQATRDLLARLDDPTTRTEVTAERAFLARLEGGCQVPIAGRAWLEGGRLHLDGLVADLTGRPLIRRALAGPPEQAEALGRSLAEEILAAGGRAILSEVYGS